jgi:hypothetical protein
MPTRGNVFKLKLHIHSPLQFKLSRKNKSDINRRWENMEPMDEAHKPNAFNLCEIRGSAVLGDPQE